MKIEQGTYTVTKMCDILGENRHTFASNQKEFYNHLNMYFNCEFVPKMRGMNIEVPEDTEEFEYTKWREAKKLRVKEKYADTAEKILAKEPYNSAANLARVGKKDVEEFHHSFETRSLYFRAEINENWTRHLGDKKWVHLVNGVQVDLTDEELQYLEDSFELFYDDNKKELIELIQDSKEGLTNLSEASKKLNSVADELYYSAMIRFKENFGFQPYKVCKINKEPLTKEDLYKMKDRAVRGAVKQINNDFAQQISGSESKDYQNARSEKVEVKDGAFNFV